MSPDPADLAWYGSQGAVTSPGRLARLLEDLPPSIDDLAAVAHGLVLHYRADRPLQLGVPRERLAEIHTRYSEAMLARLAQLRGGSLIEHRGPHERLVGCCRDFTVLLLTMARARAIPARARVGFARYFLAGIWLDHEVAEVWDEAGQCWRLLDAQLAEDHVDPEPGLSMPSTVTSYDPLGGPPREVPAPASAS